MFKFTATLKLLNELDKIGVPRIYRLRGKQYQEAIQMVRRGRPVESVALAFKGVVDDAQRSVKDDNGTVLVHNCYEAWLKDKQRTDAITEKEEADKTTMQSWMKPPVVK